MRSTPIVQAVLERRADGTPASPQYGDIYHPAGGALLQARQVFLQGNGLPARWRGRARFVLLETGFGLGNNFLATWDAWRRDPQRCGRLHFVSIESTPPCADDLAAVHRGSALETLAQQLVAAWPPATHNLHRLAFDEGRVQLLLAFGDVAAWLPQIDARVDAFLLDGFAPARNPAMWQPRLFKAMARIAAPQATAATWSAARAVRDGLQAAGFEVERAPGPPGKRDVTLARHAPRWRPPVAAPATPPDAAPDEPVLVVGAGLAGCAAAWALAEQGRRVLLLDRHDAVAREASGNPAGLFHGLVHANDGAHARFGRAAAFEAQRAIGEAIARHGVAGACQGLLRLDTSGRSADELQASIAVQGMPASYVHAVDAEAASRIAGLPLQHPAWFYPGGGWVDPAGLARSFVARGGAAVQWRGGQAVAALRASGGRWQALDAAGALIADAAQVVLANAGDALRLLGNPDWPIDSVRGQIDALDTRVAPAVQVPVAGAGYVLPPRDGAVWFGATADRGDAEALPREADRARNLAQLARLSSAYAVHAAHAVHAVHAENSADARAHVGSVRARVAWRCVSDDRLPVIGAVPDDAAGRPGARLDQARFVPRQAGLYVFTALGSRGIGSCALGAQVLAAWVTGAPMPVEADLRDALDPARFRVRRFRRGAPDQLAG